MEIRALSFKQPFADLMVHGKIETRTWDTKYRGLVLICACKNAYKMTDLLKISGTYLTNRIWDKTGAFPSLTCPLGVAIAVGRLVDTRPMTIEDEKKCFVQFNPNLFCHVYEDIREIEPIPWKGTQGWRKLNNEQILAIKYKYEPTKPN